MEYIIVGVIVLVCVGYLVYTLTRQAKHGKCSCCSKKCDLEAAEQCKSFSEKKDSEKE
jgi:hypothetical protein